MKSRKLNINYLVCLNFPNGLTYDEINQKLRDIGLPNEKMSHIQSLTRNSISLKEYTYSTVNAKNKRFVYKDGKFLPNFNFLKYHNEEMCREEMDMSDEYYEMPIKDHMGFYDLSSSALFLSMFFHKHYWMKIIKKLKEGIYEFILLQKKRNNPANLSKNVSIEISQELATVMSKILPNVEDPAKDNKPDLIINLIYKSEIKVSKRNSTTTVWRGGEYSKRFGSFFFVSWDWGENNTDENPEINISVTYTYLERKNWNGKSNKKKFEISDNPNQKPKEKAPYYGVSISEKELFEKFNSIFVYKEDFFRYVKPKKETKNKLKSAA